jgi:hypothetical protein
VLWLDSRLKLPVPFSAEGVSSLAVSYWAKDPEQQKKIDDLKGIRDAYRRQRRIWLWMMALAFLCSYILMGRSSHLAPILALICLVVGLLPLWQFIKCTRAVRMIDKGLSPYRIDAGIHKKSR